MAEDRSEVATKPSPVPREERKLTAPPKSTARRVAQETWWVPWLLGALAAGVAAVLLVPVLDGPPDSVSPADLELPHSTHEVVYEVHGAGKSPEIKFVVDGTATTETVEGANLPWRKELEVEVGPSVGVVQVMATNSGKAKEISCSIKVDGNLMHKASAPGEFSTVSCSSVIKPATD